MQIRYQALLLASLVLLCAASAHAHHLPPGMEDIDEFEDGAAFMAGLRHPLFGMSHWLFALVIGALAGMRAKKGLQLAGGMIAGLAAGAALGAQQVVMPLADVGEILAVAVPLMLLVLGQCLSDRRALAWVAAAALWQGNAHGIAWPLDAAMYSYLAGVLACTAGLIGAGAAAALLARFSRTLPRFLPTPRSN